MAAARHWILAAALTFGAACLAPAVAQDGAAVTSPVLVLDQERLFKESLVANRISAEIEQRAADLQAENTRIETQLEAEEADLTVRRPNLSPEAFRAEADAFDEKVQGIRAAQLAKERALLEQNEQERQAFLQRITPVLAEIVRERGAVVVLDLRNVILKADVIDITDAAIERVNLVFSTPETPASPDAPEPDQN